MIIFANWALLLFLSIQLNRTAIFRSIAKYTTRNSPYDFRPYYFSLITRYSYAHFVAFVIKKKMLQTVKKIKQYKPRFRF